MSIIQELCKFTDTKDNYILELATTGSIVGSVIGALNTEFVIREKTKDSNVFTERQLTEYELITNCICNGSINALIGVVAGVGIAYFAQRTLNQMHELFCYSQNENNTILL